MIDVEAYFRKIGYSGERTPTLETLRAIVERHAHSIAFENLNPLLGWPVRLDTAALEQKLIRSGRGGYCFEQNLLLLHVISALGFSAVGLSARVIWSEPDAAVAPRTHMLLRVERDGMPHIADVGFGGQTLTAPIRLEPDTEQATPHEPYRLVRNGKEFELQAGFRDTWNPLYRFDLQEQLVPDYEVGNWYVSTHPDSKFVNSLLVARAAPGRRYTLHNNALSVHTTGGGTEKRVLTDAAQLRQTLEETFELTLPNTPDLEPVLARLTTPSLSELPPAPDG